MSFIFLLDESNFTTELPRIFQEAETDIARSEPLFDIEGQRIASIAKDVPKHQGFYAKRALELKATMQWLESYKCKVEAEALKNLQRGQRVFTAGEQKALISGTRDILEVNALIIEATLLYRQLEEITESFRQMGWMINIMTKLHVATMEDALVT